MKLKVSNVIYKCEKCEVELVRDNAKAGVFFFCPKCQKAYSPVDLIKFKECEE
jgi:hypothetical protein